MTLRDENQSIELYVLPGEYLPIFQKSTLSKICCLNHVKEIKDDFCTFHDVKSSQIFSKLSKEGVESKIYKFKQSILIHDVNFT